MAVREKRSNGTLDSATAAASIYVSIRIPGKSKSDTSDRIFPFDAASAYRGATSCRRRNGSSGRHRPAFPNPSFSTAARRWRYGWRIAHGWTSISSPPMRWTPTGCRLPVRNLRVVFHAPAWDEDCANPQRRRARPTGSGPPRGTASRAGGNRRRFNRYVDTSGLADILLRESAPRGR